MSLFGFNSKSKLSKVATDNVANYRIQRATSFKQLLLSFPEIIEKRVIDASSRGELSCRYSFKNDTFNNNLQLTNDECISVLNTITGYLGSEGIKFDVQNRNAAVCNYIEHTISMNWSDPLQPIVKRDDEIEKIIQKKK